MELSPRKRISLRSTPKGKIPVESDLTPKKVRFSKSGHLNNESKGKENKFYKAEDVLSMLNDSSLSEGETTSDEEWIVTKSKALSISDSPLSQKNNVTLACTQLKNPVVKVTPLKLMRKTEYEVNKVTSNKKTDLSVSPIVLKRKTDSRNISDSLPLTPSSKCNKSESNCVENSPASLRRSQRQRTVVCYGSDFENECSPPKRKINGQKKENGENSKSMEKIERKVSAQYPVQEDSSDEECINDKVDEKSPVKAEASDYDDKCLADRIKLSTRKSALKDTANTPPVVNSKSCTPRRSARKKLELSSPVAADLDHESPDLRKKILTPRRSIRKKLELSSPKISEECKEDSTTYDQLDEIKTPKRKSVMFRDSVADSPNLRKQVLSPWQSARKRIELSSPGSTKKIRSGFLSPVVQDRTRRSILGTPTSRLDSTRANLHTSNIPSSLPCREKEFNNILTFTIRKIEDKAGGCMYISGVPGTGKTATVHAVIRLLQEKAEKGESSKFDFIEINGLRLTEPRQAYTRIWQELSGNKCSPEMAMTELEKKFDKKCKHSTVILVDELDYLCNRRQDVIYNLLEWSTKSSAAFTVITIANTMDLPERTLKGKVTSRMGLTRLVFQPYTFQQLQQIVMNRIGLESNFHVDAIQLVARKVAAVSGDARRALDICRRATELITSDSEIIKVSHIEKALSQIFAGTRVKAIKKCSVMNQFLLRAMRDEFHRTGVEETTVGQVYPQFTAITSLEGYEVPPIGFLLNMSSVLADSGLILAEKCRSDLNRKLSLNVSPDDIHYALSC